MSKPGRRRRDADERARAKSLRSAAEQHRRAEVQAALEEELRGLALEANRWTTTLRMPAGPTMTAATTEQANGREILAVQ